MSQVEATVCYVQLLQNFKPSAFSHFLLDEMVGFVVGDGESFLMLFRSLLLIREGVRNVSRSGDVWYLFNAGSRPCVSVATSRLFS